MHFWFPDLRRDPFLHRARNRGVSDVAAGPALAFTDDFAMLFIRMMKSNFVLSALSGYYGLALFPNTMPRRKLYYEKHRMEIISRNADRQAERDAEVECQIYRMYVEVSEKF